MKPLVLLAAAVALLASCSTLPAPQTDLDSLVIGTFSLDCPQGFFGGPAKHFDTQIELVFRDISSGARFTVFTWNGGWFSFPAPGSDGYLLEYSEYQQERGDSAWIVGPRAVGIIVPPAPGKIVYLGDIHLTYAPREDIHGPLGRNDQLDYEIDSFTAGKPPFFMQPHVVDWTYDVSMSRLWDQAGMIAHLKKVDSSSAWLSREIVNAE